ncbi:fascin domain-containing protein [Rhodococcus triatomae]
MSGRITRFATAGLAAAALMAGGLFGAASASAYNGPVSGCAFQTVNGNYLTAVGGGGRVSDVVHSDATQIRGWEKFTLVDSRDGSPEIAYGVQTMSGNYLTAVGGGGRITDVVHSDATSLRGWEKLTLHSLGGDWYSIQTVNGRYLTAVDGGGRVTDAIHSDATQVGAWERFHVTCGH